MQVRDRDNDDLDVSRLVDEAIWKSMHLTTADRAAQQVPCNWKFVDASDGLPRLVTELVS